MKRVSFLLYPGYSMMALAAASVFEAANQISGSQLYNLEFIASNETSFKTSAGMTLCCDSLHKEGGDTLIVGGGDLPKPTPQKTLDFIQQSPERYRRVVAICAGAFLLAEVGLLNGRQATTHWQCALELSKRYPKINVCSDKIFVSDGAIWTSAGMTAGIDLCLQLVEDDHGVDLAKSVARQLVVYHRRSGGQSQYSSMLEMSPESSRMQSVITYIRENLNKVLSVEELAEVVHLSARQFSRSFLKETGQTPAKAVQHIRAETARSLLEQSHHSVEEVARQTGFSDSNHMRRTFLRIFGQPPQALRRRDA